MEKSDITIIGAGIVGLAVANELDLNGRDVVVLEKHKTFGRESSSRNSEVIHAGIYYPKTYLKSKLCLEGKRLLYEFCKKYNIPHRRIGKLIVATTESEAKDLEKLLKQGKANGVEDLELLDKGTIEKIEPNIRAICAIYSPSTGILDSHRFMKQLELLARDKGVMFAYGCEVVGIARKGNGYQIDIIDADSEKMSLFSSFLINSAGLHADKIAEMAGIDIDKAGYKVHYSKGEYFRISANKSKLVHKLIYPTPKKASLGIHTVADLQCQLKLGPNAFYVEKIDYDVDLRHKSEFYESVKRFLPFLSPEDLTPDTAGIRPKVQGPFDTVRDFIISDEGGRSFPSLINLIGIESPGLTASLAIAKYVVNML